MAFVKEEIPKEMIKKYGIEHTDSWQVDRERDAIFFYTGGNFRGHEKSFSMIWKGEILEVWSSWWSTEDNDVTEWRGTYVIAIENLGNQKQEVLVAVKDALEGFGFFYSKDSRGIVNFDPKMNFKERV